MVPSTIGTVVLLPFPFTDLSETKLQPGVVPADSGRGDYIICQVTSKPYSDPRAVELTTSDFAAGTLRLTRLRASDQIVHGKLKLNHF